MTDWGTVLRVYREERGLTRRQLAELLRVGRPHVSKIENGKRQPSRDLAVRIRLLVNPSTATLLTGSAGGEAQG